MRLKDHPAFKRKPRRSFLANKLADETRAERVGPVSEDMAWDEILVTPTPNAYEPTEKVIRPRTLREF